MPATRQDIVIPQNGTFEYTIGVTRFGVPVSDMTSAQMTIREARNEASPVLGSAASPDSITINNPGSQITITLTDETTLAMSWDQGYYDVYVTRTGGAKHRVAEGRARLSPAVTRS